MKWAKENTFPKRFVFCLSVWMRSDVDLIFFFSHYNACECRTSFLVTWRLLDMSRKVMDMVSSKEEIVSFKKKKLDLCHLMSNARATFFQHQRRLSESDSGDRVGSQGIHSLPSRSRSSFLKDDDIAEEDMD